MTYQQVTIVDAAATNRLLFVTTTLILWEIFSSNLMLVDGQSNAYSRNSQIAIHDIEKMVNVIKIRLAKSIDDLIVVHRLLQQQQHGQELNSMQNLRLRGELPGRMRDMQSWFKQRREGKQFNAAQ